MQGDNQSQIGEINQAKKLRKSLIDCGFNVSEIIDIFQLFGVKKRDDTHFKILEEMAKTNRLLAEVDQEMIVDFDNAPHVPRPLREFF